MIYIKKYQNNNKENGKTYGKWYGRVMAFETIDLDGLCAHIASHGTIFTADVVSGTVKKFVQCIQELLLEGKKVKLDGIGTFYLSARTQGAETAEEFTAANVKTLRVRFLADQSADSNYTSNIIRNRASLKVGAFADSEDSGSSSTSSGGQQQGGGTSGSVEEQP